MSETSIKLQVTGKNYPIPIEMRPIWRVSILLVILAEVGKSKGYLDLTKLNVLIWMVIRRKNWEKYADFLTDQNHKVPLVSVDTATYKAIEIAVSRKMIKIEGKKIYLIETGRHFYSVIKQHSILTDEIDFLNEYGRKLTLKKVNLLTGKERV